MLPRATLTTRRLPTQKAKDAKAAVAILYHLKTDTIARVNHKEYRMSDPKATRGCRGRFKYRQHC